MVSAKTTLVPVFVRGRTPIKDDELVMRRRSIFSISISGEMIDFRLFSCGLVPSADGGGKKTTVSAFSATIRCSKNAFAQMNAHASRSRRQPCICGWATSSPFPSAQPRTYCTTRIILYVFVVSSPKPFHIHTSSTSSSSSAECMSRCVSVMDY